jgi:peptidoglycan/xylan/chitin deacetylase (PgdA/CDA1 family)
MSFAANIRGVVRRSALSPLKGAGVFRWVKNSEWRRERLLILCYHGISLEDEHEWWPALFLTPQLLERRLQMLKEGGYGVLPLSEALTRLYRHDLPPRSVAITFDDGTYDFYRQAHPRLAKFNFPATVYLSTYYSNSRRPVFHLICLYMLWKARNRKTPDFREFGVAGPIDLSSSNARVRAIHQIVAWCDSRNLNGQQRDEVAAELALKLKIDYPALCDKRILQLMNREEVRQLADAGIDFQLHTHRHRTPLDETLFRKEIEDNRQWIASAAGKWPEHFCYPSGVYRSEFLPWLAAEKVLSATTCETGLASPNDHPLLLPRLVDTAARTDREFESWIDGVGQFLSLRKRSRFS